MPIVKDGRNNKEKFKCKEPEEVKVIETAKDEYCKNHDNYEFVREFFDVRSFYPGQYIRSVKIGRIKISKESWVKLTDYASTL
jgi:hypothetical protein